jgi:ribose 5-phosphate isomerase B
MTTTFDKTLPIAIGADHAGFEYKELLKKHLEAQGWAIDDKGTHSTESTDYPDYAHPVALAVADGAAACGILICGSGIGVSITANRHKGVRAALCWQSEIAALCRQHNNANVLCMPARFISEEELKTITATFLGTAFEGGRHERRVAKMEC